MRLIGKRDDEVRPPAVSHISVHTWPEVGFAAADMFLCGDAVSPASPTQ